MIRTAITTMLVLTLSSASLKAQRGGTATPQANALTSAIQSVQSNDYAPYDLQVIADHHFQAAIPLLRQRFSEAKDDELKGKLAVVLLELGDSAHKEDYFRYLQNSAKPAVDSDEPWPYAFGPDGSDTKVSSPAFLDWVRRNHTTTDASEKKAFFTDPMRVALLSGCPDVRAVPLLLRALHSPNYILRAQASEGLFRLEGKDAAPAILSAAAATPNLQRRLILRPLLQSANPSIRAQAQKLEPVEPASKQSQ